MPRRTEKPFDKIMTVRTTLQMYAEYGDVALKGRDPQDFAKDVREIVEYLMEFRNIINGMVGFEQPPSEAVIPYLSDEAIASINDPR